MFKEVKNGTFDNCFIVTSHGWSASNWTAHSLNLNNEILCTHSARNELAEDKDLQSNSNLKKHINHLQKGYKSRQIVSLDDLYDKIIIKGEATYYGSVHVLRLRDLFPIYKNFGISERKYAVVNIVRHPVDLVWSGYGQFKDLFRYDINELYWTTGKVVNQALEFSNFISEKYNLYMGDFENLAFIGACSVLESLKKDIDSYEKVKNIENIYFKGTFQMEKITRDPDSYKEFMISLGLIELVNDDYLEKVFSTGILNKHKKDSKKLNPSERYEQFLPWQKEVFNHFFLKHDLQSKYEEFGYDFNFLK